MYIHREGYRIITYTAIIMTVIVLLAQLIPGGQSIIHYIIYVALTGTFVWTVSFFRVPLRKPVIDPNAVVSSADGTVVVIEEVEETEYFKDKRIQISVFMSPFNVHVNWYPMSGVVSYSKYHPGKFLVAYNPKSSTENERNTLVIKNENGVEVLVRQIAGMMARRIISYVKTGNIAKQGNEFGIIRFGSRVDFFVPLDAALKVKLGDKVSGQKTILATLK